MTIQKSLLSLIIFLVGCGDNTESFDVPKQTSEHSSFSIETDNLIVKNELPFIRQQCPGLDKYAVNFERNGVSDDSLRSVTTIQFHIKEDNNIPSEYTASDHNCFLFISNDTHEVKISKSACQSVCFDKTNVPGGDLIIKIDKENIPMTDDGKPPREGCLRVFSTKPEHDSWTCPRLN